MEIVGPLLRDPDPEARYLGVFLVKRLSVPTEALPRLIELLRDRERVSTARSYVPSVLGDMGPRAAAAVPALTEALEDRDETLRGEARKALRKIRGESP